MYNSGKFNQGVDWIWRRRGKEAQVPRGVCPWLVLLKASLGELRWLRCHPDTQKDTWDAPLFAQRSSCSANRLASNAKAAVPLVTRGALAEVGKCNSTEKGPSWRPFTSPQTSTLTCDLGMWCGKLIVRVCAAMEQWDPGWKWLCCLTISVQTVDSCWWPDLWGGSGASHVTWYVDGWYLNHISSPEEVWSESGQGLTCLNTSVSFLLLQLVEKRP